MAHESFEDAEVAKLINEKFISIKVDREERPDIDAIYMKVCQRMTGQGGWPLSIFMTPEQMPFYAGTYFPKESRYGLPGIKEVIRQLSDVYHHDPEQIEEVTASVKNSLNHVVFSQEEKRISKDVVDQAFYELGKTFDPVYGGFESAPKFPQPHYLMFLMRYYKITNKKSALKMVEKTLKSMARGGLFDHIGFGFARYSTDEEWLVPHFEKMLYDQALLLMTYTEAYQLTQNHFYKKISEQIIEFVKREMTSKEGAFYSAIDADSEGKEGAYYVFGRREVLSTLGDELGELYCQVYNVTTEGNFKGKNIPNLIHTDFNEIVETYNLTDDQLDQKLEEARHKLLVAREKRKYPHLDDKILTSWNAMMVAALAKAGQVFNNDEYVMMAQTAVKFLEDHLIQNGRVMARYRDHEVKYKGYLDDYAYLVWAYLELYDTTFDVHYLQQAKTITTDMVKLFWDDEHGGFLFSGQDSEKLISNDKEIHDGAIPSGNSVASVVLSRISALTGDVTLSEYVETQYRVFSPVLSRIPQGSTFFLISLLLTDFPTNEIVVVYNNRDDVYQRINKLKRQYFLPQSTWIFIQNVSELSEEIPFAKEFKLIDGRTTVYVCENFACQFPTTDYKQVINLLKLED